MPLSLFTEDILRVLIHHTYDILFVGNITSNMGDLELYGKLHFVRNDHSIPFLMPLAIMN
jgi:hypothetical protein